jgi:tetratricopeptide (TPR) repeat protein
MGRAWAGLATCHAFLGPLAGIAYKESLQRAKASALKALAINEDLPDARCAIGFVAAVLEYDWPEATRHFRRALECSPDHANSHLWFAAHVLAPMGCLKEAAYHAERACQLDPLSPPALAGLGGSRLMSRLPDQAIAACRRALELDRSYPFAIRFLGEAHLIEGRIHDALETFSSIDAPVIAAGFRAFCLARSGRQADARRLLREIESCEEPPMALQAAAAHLGLGDVDSAFTTLGKACEERSMGVHWLSVEPFWDPLRADPRFAGLLARLNLVS